MKSGAVNTEDLEVGQAKPRIQSGTGPAMESLSAPEQEAGERVVPVSHIDLEYVANIAFSREKITIRVNESTDENAEKTVTVWNNGEPMTFTRGEDATCERRFVESLMRAKPTRYTQKAILDDLGKVGGYQEVPHTALRYPFTVVRDDNPLGGTWLKSILAQA